MNLCAQPTTWTTTLIGTMTGESRAYENVVADWVISNEAGDQMPIRALRCLDGSVLEYPMNSYITVFSPERDQVLQEINKQRMQNLNKRK